MRRMSPRNRAETARTRAGGSGQVSHLHGNEAREHAKAGFPFEMCLWDNADI